MKVVMHFLLLLIPWIKVSGLIYRNRICFFGRLRLYDVACTHHFTVMIRSITKSTVGLGHSYILFWLFIFPLNVNCTLCEKNESFKFYCWPAQPVILYFSTTPYIILLYIKVEVDFFFTNFQQHLFPWYTWTLQKHGKKTVFAQQKHLRWLWPAVYERHCSNGLESVCSIQLM
jgi:hypothetical protein